MEISITDLNEVEKEMMIDVPAEELVPHFDQALKRNLPQIEIKGFRKGKAPLDLIKKIYGESIEYNSLDTVASDVYKKIVKERNINPIGEPVLTDIDYKRGEKLTFKIKYEIKPVVEVKDYKDIVVEKITHKVTDNEIENEILRLRKSNSAMTEAETATDDEHVITADMQELDESGSPLIGKKTPNMRLYLASETIYQQIKEALLGCSVGVTKRVAIETKQQDSKQINHLEFKVKKIEKVNVPDFDDAFIKKITKEKVTTVEDFRKHLRDDLETYWKERSERKLMDDIVGEIVRRHEITVPESIVKGVTDSLVEELTNRYPNKKLPAGFNEKEFREKNRSYAIFQAKWYLIRERIIEVEGLKIDEAAFDRLAETEAPKTGIDKERLLTFYKSSNAVKDRMLSEKLTAFLKEHSKITEKVTEEFID
jgi:trigger factor